MNIEKMNIGDYLKEHGIKPSYQRIKILEYMLFNRNHPTVDMIYQELSKDIPTLSKTTVYNTLKLFIEKKVAIVITIEENETRFDAEVSTHGHFKCISCGNIYDFDVELEGMNIKGLENFSVLDEHVYFTGICKNCEKNKSK